MCSPAARPSMLTSTAVGRWVASASRETMVSFEVVDGARSNFAGNVDGDVDGDLLALADGQEVDVLDDLLDRDRAGCP